MGFYLGRSPEAGFGLSGAIIISAVGLVGLLAVLTLIGNQSKIEVRVRDRSFIAQLERDVSKTLATPGSCVASFSGLKIEGSAPVVVQGEIQKIGFATPQSEVVEKGQKVGVLGPLVKSIAFQKGEQTAISRYKFELKIDFDGGLKPLEMAGIEVEVDPGTKMVTNCGQVSAAAAGPSSCRQISELAPTIDSFTVWCASDEYVKTGGAQCFVGSAGTTVGLFLHHSGRVKSAGLEGWTADCWNDFATGFMEDAFTRTFVTCCKKGP